MAEIYRLDEQIEELQRDIYYEEQKVSKLIQLLQEHNIEIPDLDSEITDQKRSRLLKDIEYLRERLEKHISDSKESPNFESKKEMLEEKIKAFESKLREL